MKTRGNRQVQIKWSKLRKVYTEITEKEILANIWDHIYLDPCHETLPCTICLIILFLEELLKRQFIKLLFITCLDKVIYDRYCVLRAILLYYHCAASIDIDWNLLDWHAKKQHYISIWPICCLHWSGRFNLVFPWAPVFTALWATQWKQVAACVHLHACVYTHVLVMYTLLDYLIISALHSLKNAETFQYQIWREQITLILWFLWWNSISEEYTLLKEGSEIPIGRGSKSVSLPLILLINLLPAPFLHSYSQDQPCSSPCFQWSFILWPAQQALALSGLL